MSTLIFADVIKTKNEYIDKLKERIDRLESRAQHESKPQEVKETNEPSRPTSYFRKPQFEFDLALKNHNIPLTNKRRPAKKKITKKKK